MATSEKCACLSLHKSARIIGTVLFIMTVGLFVAYLIFIENLRRIVLEVSWYFRHNLKMDLLRVCNCLKRPHPNMLGLWHFYLNICFFYKIFICSYFNDFRLFNLSTKPCHCLFSLQCAKIEFRNKCFSHQNSWYIF